jgi:hypothetical protein
MTLIEGVPSSQAAVLGKRKPTDSKLATEQFSEHFAQGSLKTSLVEDSSILAESLEDFLLLFLHKTLVVLKCEV